jgi:hypothetical protein
MKKIIYIILLALSASLSITSCTEEEITPLGETKSSGSGGGSDVGKI